jgi:hypothetical protein
MGCTALAYQLVTYQEARRSFGLSARANIKCEELVRGYR